MPRCWFHSVVALVRRPQCRHRDLTQRKVGVIVLTGFISFDELVQQVRASPIPIVFGIGGDPVRQGFVVSMNRPGGTLQTRLSTRIGELPKTDGRMVAVAREQCVSMAGTIELPFEGGIEPRPFLRPPQAPKSAT